ncbi:MAG: class B sortase [Coriobacteriales bacterium]|jgi:sortase B
MGKHDDKDGSVAGGTDAAAEQPKKKRKKRALLIVEIICIVVFVICAVLLGQQIYKYYVADQDFKEVTQTYQRDIERLKSANKQCQGWIQVKDTRIDYPVMYTPKDPEYYLHRNFKGDYSFAGTPFFGENSAPNNPTTNSMIIYAHHMRDGSMFGELEKFNDSSFAKSHKIKYKDRRGSYTYHAVYAFYVDLSSGSYYRYWDHVGTLDKKQFEKFAKNVKERSIYSTGEDLKYGDRVLMLSTCSYGTSEQRFVVIAVRDEN